MSADDQSRRPSIYARSPVTSIGDSQDSGSPLPTTLHYLSDNDTTPTTAAALQQTPLRDANHKDWWMPDNACKECYKCQERFHIFFRRHHCRLCGLIFCYKCSGNFVYGHEYGFQNQELVRACDDCYAVLPTLMNNTKSPRNYNARRQNHRPQSSSHSNRSLRSGKRRAGSGGGVPGTGSKSSNQTNSSSGRINRQNKKKPHKISRTGTEGINARFDGQTYPAGYVGVNGVDLEFDDIHSDQEEQNPEDLEDIEVEDSPTRPQTSKGQRRQRRRLSHKKNAMGGRGNKGGKGGQSGQSDQSGQNTKKKHSGFGEGFFPTNPSSSEEEDHFVTSEILNELTKSPRASIKNSSSTKKKKKNRSGTGSRNSEHTRNNGSSSAKKPPKGSGPTRNHQRSRSISMNQNGYRERVLSSMTSGPITMLGSQSLTNHTIGNNMNLLRTRGESIAMGEQQGRRNREGNWRAKEEAPGPFTLFAALKRANEEHGQTKRPSTNGHKNMDSTHQLSRRHRSMEEHLLLKRIDITPPDTPPVASSPSSSSSSSSSTTTSSTATPTTTTFATNLTLSPVLEGTSSPPIPSAPLPTFEILSSPESLQGDSMWGGSRWLEDGEDTTLSELQLQMLQLSTSDHLKSDIHTSLVPVLGRLKLYHQQQEASSSTPSSFPPTLDEHILVRKVLALVRQAMQVSSYPTGDDSDSGPSTMDGRHPELCYDISQFVRVKPIPGGDVLKDSKFVHGVVFNKNIADRAMRKTIRRPRIVLVSDGIEWKHRSGGGIVSMETVRDQERKYIEIMVAKISSLRPDLLITSGAVSSFAIELFKSTRLNCTVVRNVDPSVLKSIARFTDATILSNAHVASHFAPDDVIGTCGVFDVKKHAGSPFVYLEEENVDNDVLGSRGHDIGDSGVSSSRSLEGSVGTILIHTGKDHINQTISMILRRLVRSSIAAAYSLSMESHYLNDTHGALPHSTNDDNSDSSNNHHHHHHHQDHNRGGNGIQRIRTVPVKNSSSSTSNSGAPLWVTRSMVVLAENNNQLNTDVLRNHTRNNSGVNSGMPPMKNNNKSIIFAPKHSSPQVPQVPETSSTSASATASTSAPPASHSPPPQPLLLHDAFGRSKEVSFACCWRHPEEHRQCCPPTEVNIRFYSMDDRPLGLWMRQQCFNYEFPCLSNKCKRRAIEHRLAYTRPEGQLSIRTEIMESEDVTYIRERRARQLGRYNAAAGTEEEEVVEEEEEEEVILDPDQIYTWGFCKICCEIVTPVTPLTRQTLAMSFGRFLESWFFNDQVVCRDQNCNHRLHRDHIRFYGRFDSQEQPGLAARFEFNEIKTFTLSIPGVKNDNDEDSSGDSPAVAAAAASTARPPSSSRLRPRLEPPHSPSASNEIQFLRDATSVLFQAFQERMRGFLMERLIRGCLQRFYGMSKVRRMAGQELYTRLRASWWEVWNNMMEEQEALSSLLGIPSVRGGPTTIVGSPETIKTVKYNASLWTSKGVKELELYALRRRLIQMVDQWNINMMAMYTNIINVAYNGEWSITGKKYYLWPTHTHNNTQKLILKTKFFSQVMI